MPTWLVHGFRWPRRAIRIHIILENLDDCAAEWLMAPATIVEMTANFRKLYPDQMKYLPGLRFIEQYDPDDLTVKDQPYAYVCDQVREVKLGMDVDEVKEPGASSEASAALEELRDKIADGEKVGWFVVVNGDLERWAPPIEDEEEEEEEEEEEISENGVDNQVSLASQRSSVGRVREEDGEPKKKGLKKWLGKVRRSKSMKDLSSQMAIQSTSISPPLPNLPNSTASPKTANGKAPMSVGAA